MTESGILTMSPRVKINTFSRVFACATVSVLIAEILGPVSIPLGGAYKVVLLPLIWALLIGGVWGVLSPRLPDAVGLDVSAQNVAGVALQAALLLFIAKLGFLVGGSLPKILDAGWALLFQEFGHFFGTAFIGLPVALLLGIKREAIGATFSVGREPSLAIIGEKYGMSSPEGHGVLAEYITGTVFGAIFVSLLASVVTGLAIFHPHALAMGAGMGSGSMMAAASASIAAQQTPEMAKEVAAFAAASNLLTSTVGTYFTLFLSLPFTVWAYRILEPILGRFSRARTSYTATTENFAAAHAGTTPERLTYGQTLATWVVTSAIAVVGNYIGYNIVPAGDVLWGMAILLAAVIAGHLCYKAAGRTLPAVLWVSLIAMGMAYPGMPYAIEVTALTGKINFLALATPIIAFAGLSIAKDMPVFKKLGWRIVVVSLMANAGTFMGGTIVAQFFIGSHQ